MLFLIIFIITLASGFIFTWWAIAITAFVAAFYAGKTSSHAFWSGFFAIAAAWLILILFKTLPNDHILADRIAKMLQLPGWIFVMIITLLIGAIVGGMAALSGLLLKRIFNK